MERKSLTYFKALICAFGLVLAGSPPGMVFAKENDTKQEASAGSGGSVYRATDAKDMAEHVSVMNNGASDRLIVSETADLSGFLDKGTAVYYDGTYIISFENSGDQKTAYQTLREEFGEDAVFHDARLSVCGNETEDEQPKEQEMDQTDDEVVQEDEKAVPEEASESDGMPLVAMIDTGCNDENVYQSLNLTSEVPDDLNGHGTQMYQYMLDAAGETDFRLLSVKAFGEDGTASVSDIITAIKYAEEEGADAICLSASARDSGDLSVLKNGIMNAIAYGIEVIVPAGNDGGDAMDYVPSDIDGVVVIGAASEDGTPLSTSNTGDCVSCYVTADSTSEAAAKYTGYLIAGKLDSEDIHYQDGDDKADENGIATYATTAGSSSGIYAVYCSTDSALYIISDTNKTRAIGDSITFKDDMSVSRNGIITQNDFSTCTGANSLANYSQKRQIRSIRALSSTYMAVSPTSTDSWFSGFTNVSDINLLWLNTSDVTSMQNMFYNCSNLYRITSLSSFNTSNVTNMNYMFQNCSRLASLDISKFDTSNVANMRSMFSGCSSLASITLGDKTVLSSNCELAPSNTITYTGKWTLTSSDNHSGQLSPSELIAKTQAAGGAPGQWFAEKQIPYTSYAAYCADNTTLYLIRVQDTYQVGDNATITDKGGVTRNCEITDIRLENASFSYTTSIADAYKSQITSVICLNTITPNGTQGMEYWFHDFSNVTSFDLSLLDTSQVIDTYFMFAGCSNLKSIDLSTFDFGKVDLFNSMFRYCSSLTSIDMSGLDTKSATDMSNMFAGCSSLTAVDMSGLNTQKVTTFSSLFSGCSSLASVNLSGLNTENVTDTKGMFRGCSKLTAIDIADFNTEKVTNMTDMFINCSSLNQITLGERTILLDNCMLPSPESNKDYTGKWTVSDPYNHTGALSAADLIAKTQKRKILQEAKPATATKYAHTSNLDDTGSGNNGYGNSVSDFQTVSIPGASKLYIQVTYQTESASFDYLRIYQGTVTTSQSNDGVAGKLGGKTKETKTIEVDGDTVTFHFRSDSIVDSYYGYYAVVTDACQEISGPAGEATGLWVAERILLNAKLQLTQYDAGTNKLGGAEYALYKEDGTPVNFTAAGTNKIVINQNGQSDVLDSTLFVAGKYYLLQTKAPDGYAATPQINFEIKDSDAGQTVQIEAHNNKLVALPSTGGTGRDEIYMNTALLFMTAGMMMLVKKKISE